MPRPEALPPEPKPKMPATKAVFAFLLALFLDALKFVCNFLIFFAPLIVGFLAGTYADSAGLPSWASNAIGVVAGGGAVALEAAGGAAVVATLGAIMSVVIGFVGWLFFIGWFLITGVPMVTRPGRFLKIVWGFVGSTVPILNSLPTFTLSIGSIILGARREDREERKKWEVKRQEAQAKRVQAERMRLAYVRRKQEQMMEQEIGEEAVVEEEAEAMREEVGREGAAAREAAGIARRRREGGAYAGEAPERQASNDELYAPYENLQTSNLPSPTANPEIIGPAANDPLYGGRIHREAA